MIWSKRETTSTGMLPTWSWGPETCRGLTTAFSAARDLLAAGNGLPNRLGRVGGVTGVLCVLGLICVLSMNVSEENSMSNSSCGNGNGQLIKQSRKGLPARSRLADLSEPASGVGLNQIIVPPSPLVVGESPLVVGESQLVVGDFPHPPVLAQGNSYLWNDDRSPVKNYFELGSMLNMSGDLYRHSNSASGLLLASSCPRIKPRSIVKGTDLAPVIVDRVDVVVVKNGKLAGSTLPAGHLRTMLKAEVFLQRFPPLDLVTTKPMYSPSFALTAPGYNDGGLGNRIYYAGEAAKIDDSHAAIDQFLGVMAFATNADRTNAVGAALTVMLRNHWPGAKPLIPVTSTKSHGGKDTVIDFLCGTTGQISVSHEKQDWAFHKNVAAAVHENDDVGVICMGNVRLDGQDQIIRSAFLERFLTEPEPSIHSTGTGDPKPRKNYFVVAASANRGVFSEDLMNRALPIHLNPVGDVASRESPIGNPRLEYLPANGERIEAELRGMIERWKAAGMPLDNTVKHPMSDWAKVIGGILMVAGYKDFLGNYGTRKTADDPLRKAMGILGTAYPDEWIRPGDWVSRAIAQGVIKKLIPKADLNSFEASEREIGCVLSDHRKETFLVETESETLTLRLERARRRFDRGEGHRRYRFLVIDRQPLPADDESDAAE